MNRSRAFLARTLENLLSAMAGSVQQPRGEPVNDGQKARKNDGGAHFSWLRPSTQVPEKIVLVQDNLNTHTRASLHEAFEPAEARRNALRFEWHYTPKHGSWLNLAESELAVSTTPRPTGASPPPTPVRR
jgi:hypothetical protein